MYSTAVFYSSEIGVPTLFHNENVRQNKGLRMFTNDCCTSIIPGGLRQEASRYQGYPGAFINLSELTLFLELRGFGQAQVP